MAFSRDSDYHDNYPTDVYLNKTSGEVLWVYEDDDSASMEGLDPEENRVMRKQIAGTPEGYLSIPGLSHGQHHDILKSFLKSNWTDDPDRRNAAVNAYIGSIGAWIKLVEDQTVVAADHVFKVNRIEEMMRGFLHDNGIGHFESDL